MPVSIGAKQERAKPQSVSIVRFFINKSQCFPLNVRICSYYAVHTPLTTTTQSTTVKRTIATETSTSRRPRPSNSSPTRLFLPTSMMTTETYRSVTLYQHTPSDEVDVLTSSNRPVQDVIYKNLSFHKSQSSSSPKLARYDLVQLFLIPSIVISFTIMSNCYPSQFSILAH